MAAIATQVISRSGVTVVYTSANTSGDSFIAGPDIYLAFVNTTASKTVTLTPPAGGGPLGTTVSPVTLAVATTGTSEFGPFPAIPFADGSGAVAMTYSAVSNLTVAVKKHPS